MSYVYWPDPAPSSVRIALSAHRLRLRKPRTFALLGEKPKPDSCHGQTVSEGWRAGRSQRIIAAMRTLCLGLLAAITIVAAAPSARAGVKEGDHFVELDGAKTADGKTFKLKTMSGHWVLYSFGAKWCQPCHKELPAWDKLAPKYAGKVAFVAVNINNDPAEGKD